MDMKYNPFMFVTVFQFLSCNNKHTKIYLKLQQFNQLNLKLYKVNTLYFFNF